METSSSLQWEFFSQKRLSVIIGIIAAFFLFLSIPHAHAADMYWVGGTSDRFENPSNWAAQPRGSIHPAAYPGSSDLAIFSYSGGIVRIRSNVAVQGIMLAANWTGSLLQGTGTVKVTGVTGIRVGSGRFLGGNALIQATSTTGSGFTQTGGIVSGIQNILSMSGSFKVANTAPSKPTYFSSTGTLVFSGNANQTFTDGKVPNVSTSIMNVTLKNSGGSNTTNVVTASGTSLSLSGALSITTGTLSVSQSMVVVGNITIADSTLAGMTISSTNTLMFAGNWTKGGHGTFTSNSSTVILSGTTQTMSGATTFYNLARTTAGTLNFAAGLTQTVSNTLTLQGTAAHNLLLRSTTTGSQWHLVPTLLDNHNGTVTISNLDVEDSVVDVNATIYCLDKGCLDSGNNVRWNIFNNAAATTTTSSDSGGGGGGGRRTTPTTASGNPPVQTSTQPPIPAKGQNLLFTDVPSNQWFASYVSLIFKAGMISGYKDAKGNPSGLYGPGNNVTYAELAKMALEGSGHHASNTTGHPKNASARGQWSEKYIKLAEDLHLSVYQTSLNVNQPASRGAVLQTIFEALGITLDPAGKNTYKDVAASSPYARAIATATRLGIVSGDTDAQGKHTGTFRPTSPINRAEVAKILALALHLQ